MLTRIRNAVTVRHETVTVPTSKLKVQLLRLLKDEGFIQGYEEVVEEGRPALKVGLKYYQDKEPVIHGLKRVSKPGLRVYVGRDEIPRYFGGIGVPFMSTANGIMTGRQARKAGNGGELLFYVW